MNERPLTNEPGYENPSNEADVIDYNDVIAHETIRVAVLDMVGDTPMHRSLPEPFQPLVREMFLDYYDMYNLRIEESLHRDAQNMRDIFDAGRGKFRWRSLLVALEETKSLVEESLGDRLEDDDDDDNDEDDEDDEDDEEGGEQEEKAGGMAGGGKAVA
mmetsp:Transcript_10324/g.30892  ORF Transcript_10324/g.30892 Transcript_10324/m.30892 type:complete len:159 (-) Transcript_10324:321-797(-)